MGLLSVKVTLGLLATSTNVAVVAEGVWVIDVLGAGHAKQAMRKTLRTMLILRVVNSPYRRGDRSFRGVRRHSPFITAGLPSNGSGLKASFAISCRTDHVINPFFKIRSPVSGPRPPVARVPGKAYSFMPNAWQESRTTSRVCIL